MINELCDFEGLKKQWKTLDVERIKNIIVYTLTRGVVLKC